MENKNVEIEKNDCDKEEVYLKKENDANVNFDQFDNIPNLDFNDDKKIESILINDSNEFVQIKSNLTEIKSETIECKQIKENTGVNSNIIPQINENTDEFSNIILQINENKDEFSNIIPQINKNTDKNSNIIQPLEPNIDKIIKDEIDLITSDNYINLADQPKNAENHNNIVDKNEDFPDKALEILTPNLACINIVDNIKNESQLKGIF